MNKVADLLQQSRLDLKISLREISKKSKISLVQLEHVEVGNWKAFASSAYLQGVIKAYVGLLGLDEVKILALLRREMKEKDVNFIRQNQELERSQFLPKNVYFLLLLLTVLSFFLIKFVVFIQKPFLNIKPVAAVINQSKPLKIEGQTAIGAIIYLNGEQIFQDEKGWFKEEIYLKKGRVNLELRIVGRNGQETVRNYSINVKP